MERTLWFILLGGMAIMFVLLVDIQVTLKRWNTRPKSGEETEGGGE